MKMLILYIFLIVNVFVICCDGQLLQNQRFRRFPMRAALKLKNRLREKIDQYKERNTKMICYDVVGCFNLPHKNSPLQKIPEDPRILQTKFYLFTNKLNFSQPEILFYDDEGKSLKGSTFNISNPLKLVIHGYMSKWNEKGALIIADTYLNMYDCNVILLDWRMGARRPHYTTAAANTEIVGRQLGMLLLQMVENGMSPKKMHLIGFSLGAHVAGTAAESLKNRDMLLGRITGLDAASPLFRNNYLREKYKKLDRGDADFVDVLHTDSSPFVTDGFGLWEPIGHVDFFPNGGQEQPGCNDVKSIITTRFEGSFTRETFCSHIRAFHLFIEALVNKQKGKHACQFTSYSCPGGLLSFEKGLCFPQLDKENSSLALDSTYRSEIGRFGEDVTGEGVMYFATKSGSPFCGTQLQASVQISQKTGFVRGIIILRLQYLTHIVNFQIKCEIEDFIMTGLRMNGIAVAEYNTLRPDTVENITASLGYMDLEIEEKTNKTSYVPTVYFDRVVVRDMLGNSWQYCKKDTILEDTIGTHFNLLSINLSRTPC